MNVVRGILYTSIRGYRGSAGNRRVRPERKTQMVQSHMPVEGIHEIEENEDFDDLDAYESDFRNVAEYDKMHQREIKSEKSKLKRRIVRDKCFKVKDPPLLTWSEKEQLRFLHGEDPELWTCERLSEGFPALPETIQKILKSRWKPTSAKVVEKYEENVRKNWNLFRAGRLPVDHRLAMHLEKFKDRKIKPLDKDSIEKYLKPKPVFPKPKSNYFTSMVANYATKDEPRKEENYSHSLPQIESGSSTVNFPKNERVTLDMFLEKHVQDLEGKEITPVDRVIVDNVKQKHSEDYKSMSLLMESKHASSNVEDIKKTEELFSKRAEESLSNVQTTKTEIPVTLNESNSETGIISRTKKLDLCDNISIIIKIPKNMYKKGLSYRVGDCYYDDDGTFLYRIPGLYS